MSRGWRLTCRKTRVWTMKCKTEGKWKKTHTRPSTRKQVDVLKKTLSPDAKIHLQDNVTWMDKNLHRYLNPWKYTEGRTRCGKKQVWSWWGQNESSRTRGAEVKHESEEKETRSELMCGRCAGRWASSQSRNSSIALLLNRRKDLHFSNVSESVKWQFC